MKIGKSVMVLALAASLMSIGAAAQQSQGGDQGQTGAKQGEMRRHHGPGGPGMMGMWGGPEMLHHMFERLNLTQQQQDQIKSIMQQHHETMANGQNMSQAHDALAKQIFTDNPNQSQIQSQANDLKQQMSRMIDDAIQTGIQINQVLTAEQRQQLQQMMTQHEQMRDQRRQEMKQRRQQRQNGSTGSDTQQPK